MFGTAYTQTQKIISSSPSAAGNFGVSVVIDGYYAVVGEASPGNTHLYKRSIEGVWVLQQVFPIAGRSVSIYNNYENGIIYNSNIISERAGLKFIVELPIFVGNKEDLAIIDMTDKTKGGIS